MNAQLYTIKKKEYKVVVVYDKNRRLVDCMKNVLQNRRKNFS